MNNVRALNTAKDELHKYFQSLYELDPKIKLKEVAAEEEENEAAHNQKKLKRKTQHENTHMRT